MEEEEIDYEIQEGSEIPIIDDPSPGIIASTLGPQLGSEPEFLDRNKFDMRIITIISAADREFFVYAKLRARKSRAWRIIYDELLHLNVSVGGMGRRQIIQMEEVSHGGAGRTETEIREPGSWWGKHVANRGWELKQRREAMGR